MGLRLNRHGKAQQYLYDHNALINTELENQHPIVAITGLQEALNNINTELGNKVSQEDFSQLVNEELVTVKEDIKNTNTKLDGVDNRVTVIEKKIENGEIGGGGGSVTPTSLKHTVVLEYQDKKLIKETFAGDITKTVDYTYDANGNITKKAVTKKDNKVVEATYEYDNNGNLIKVTDNGIDEIYIAGGGSSGGGAIDVSPLVDRVKTLEQNINILNNNNTELKKALAIVLTRLTNLTNHVESIELTVDEEHKITSTKDCSFTDTLVNGDNIESLVDCEVKIDTDSIR